MQMKWFAMRMSKLGYFSEFLLFPPILGLAVLIALRSAKPPHMLVWLLLFAAALGAWTLIEYLVHRLVYHHVPILSDLHQRHHHAPEELFGASPWVTALLGLVLVGGPSVRLLGFDLGMAVLAGLVSGYLWYVFVHYATHHITPRRGSYLYRMRMRHGLHHHRSDAGNFGVTTGFWDTVFDTTIEAPRTLRAYRAE